MLIIHVHVHVRPECVQEFCEATIENARHSIQEPGIARFDVVQQTDDPTRFVLIEVYHDEAATRAHKETSHYAKWRETVAPMMAETRTSSKFKNLFPESKDW
jgi:autoinducer 2-degrading protein